MGEYNSTSGGSRLADIWRSKDLNFEPVLRYNRGSRPNGRVLTARFFWPLDFDFIELTTTLALQDIVEQTVTGLGYDLVEIERSAGGLLRITIDWPWQPGQGAGLARLVNVEDCEKVTRQLQFALEVDAIEYRRLEVSSPGIDRPLRHLRDFERFVGEVVDLTLKAPLGAAAQGQVSANRKKFRGVLERTEALGWQITWRDELKVKPGQKVSKKRELPPLQALGFELEELREARLAPIVNFKGRGHGEPMAGQ